MESDCLIRCNDFALPIIDGSNFYSRQTAQPRRPYTRFRLITHSTRGRKQAAVLLKFQYSPELSPVRLHAISLRIRRIGGAMYDCIAAHQRLLFKQNQVVCGIYSSAPSIRHLSVSIKTPFPFLPDLRFLQTTAQTPPKCSSKSSRQNPFLLPLQIILPSLIFSAAILFLRLLPHDLPLRWRHLLTFSEEAEAAGAHLPSHVWQAVVACEDRRFFSHCGIDFVGILRAILLYPDGGGGSTITQQIYWGHRLYGVEAASAFYFGKHPSLLSLGESAMLAGIIPSPERRSPLTEPSRGKTSQARALRRMVEAGFLDVETALLVVNQPLCLHVDEPKHANGVSCSSCSSLEEGGKSKKVIGEISDEKEIWNWEKASAAWKVREDMVEWAMRIRGRSA